MRTVGLILTTVILGVASAAWWRDFSPTDSLDSPPNASPSPQSDSQPQITPTAMASFESDTTATVNPETLAPASGPIDPAEPPERTLRERDRPLVADTNQATKSESEPTKRRQSQAAIPAKPPEPVPEQSPDTPSSRQQTLAMAGTELPLSASQAPVSPPAEPATQEATTKPLESSIKGTNTAHPDPGVETHRDPSTSDQGVFEVPRIAAELVSERRAATVYFELDKAELLPEAQTTLSNLVDDLREANAVLRIQIDGHCDDTGSDDYNQRLSEQRSESVLGFLNQYGMSAPEQVLRGFGERVRAVPSTDSEARALNRRAHVRIDWVRRRQLDVTAADAPAQ